MAEALAEPGNPSYLPCSQGGLDVEADLCLIFGRLYTVVCMGLGSLQGQLARAHAAFIQPSVVVPHCLQVHLEELPFQAGPAFPGLTTSALCPIVASYLSTYFFLLPGYILEENLASFLGRKVPVSFLSGDGLGTEVAEPGCQVAGIRVCKVTKRIPEG